MNAFVDVNIISRGILLRMGSVSDKYRENFRFMVPCIVFFIYLYIQISSKMQQLYLVLLQDYSTCFGHSAPIIRSTLTAVGSHRKILVLLQFLI
jgi:hypothetical protein